MLRGFTLIELLITITIIGLLAGITLGALQAARQTARKAKTKAMIAKLDQVIKQRYESYLTRRVPIRTRGLQPILAAQMRLDALRDLMRMEMPERWNDVSRPPVVFSGWPGPIQSIEQPALSRVYRARYQPAGAPDPLPTAEFGPAECLYMIVAHGSPGAMENFSPNDIGDADEDGFPEFHDGWGRPIMFLRWAPGFTDQSEIQSEDLDPSTGDYLHPDPFDPRNVRGGFHLIPLIYSGGRDKQYDLDINGIYAYQGDPYASGAGTPFDEDGDGLNHHDNIHNHYQSQE
jgi:prepilin-type N-terminal cleavage/methylation domain-containing protein